MNDKIAHHDSTMQPLRQCNNAFYVNLYKHIVLLQITREPVVLTRLGDVQNYFGKVSVQSGRT
jgi:hypothetical protein